MANSSLNINQGTNSAINFDLNGTVNTQVVALGYGTINTIGTLPNVTVANPTGTVVAVDHGTVTLSNPAGTFNNISTGTINVGTFNMASGTLNLGTVNMSSGTLNLGTVNMTSGTVNVGTFVNNGGTVAVVQNAGTLQTGANTIGNIGSLLSGTINVGTFVMLSGTLNAGTINTGTINSGTINTGTFTLSTGTINSIGTIGTIGLGTFVMSSGTFNVGTATTNQASGTLNVGTINTGTFQQSPIPTMAAPTYGTHGTTGASLVGTLVGGTGSGAGTEIFVTSVSLTIPQREVRKMFPLDGEQVLGHSILEQEGLCEAIFLPAEVFKKLLIPLLTVARMHNSLFSSRGRDSRYRHNLLHYTKHTLIYGNCF